MSIFVSAANKKIKIACVGNSVTYGYTLPDREKNCYPSQLQTLLGDQYEVGNFGKSGATLLSKGHRPYIQQQEYKDALAFSGDIVIIHLGLNDTDPRNWPNYRDDFFRDYQQLIHSFRVANPNAEIWICRLSPITYQHFRFISGTRDWYRQIQNEIEQIAVHEDVGLIDLQMPLYNRPDLLPDALHPNVEGAGIISKTVYSALTGKYGGLQMSPIYSDNMVLQRNTDLVIRGVADADEKITVEIGSQKQSTITSKNGLWEVTLKPLDESREYTLIVKSPNRKLEYKNILVGEVWLCSGQSNMAFPLRNDADFDTTKETLKNSNIRIFNMPPRWETYSVEWDKQVLDSLNRLEYYKNTSWKVCDESSASEFSAVAYYFGKMLADSLNVPIGLIHNAVGGSPLEAWVDRSTLEEEFPTILNNWMENDFIQDWIRSRAKLNVKKADNKGQRHPYEPCYLFESGIIPLDNYPIKGVVWYQGESNAHNIETHEKLFPLFVNSWRKNWNNPNLPIYYVQLSSLNRPSWTWFRDSQRRLMDKIPNIHMAVSSDRGDSLDVHPRQKKDVGERLARLSLYHTYGKSNLIPSGPLYRSVDFADRKAYVSFNYSDGLKAEKGSSIEGFEIAEVDGLFYPAQAHIEGNKVILSSDSVSNPQYVRYGWQPFTRANLVNQDNLPASTFRAEKKRNVNIKSKNMQRLADYPIQGGISAPFSGINNNKLIVVGGCNFPDLPASDGGTKVFYDDIFYLDLSQSNPQWVKGATMPYSVAYGVSVVYEDGIICIGGQNDDGALSDVCRIYFDDNSNKLKIDRLPSLPTGVFNAGATIIDNSIYLVGGVSSDKKYNCIYTLDLKKLDKTWQKIETNQQEQREQVAVFSYAGDLFMAGGYNEQTATAFSDILKFDFNKNKWNKFSDILINGKPDAFVGTGCIQDVSSSNVLFVGGVNYDIFTSALKRIQKRQKAIADGDEILAESLKQAGIEYMSRSPEWYKFRTDLLQFDVKSKNWNIILTNYSQLARAGAALASDSESIYIICGELKPGIRTAEVNRLILK